MRARLTKLGAVLGALAAFALGGSALASAAHKSAPPAPPAAQSQSNQVAPASSTAVADTPTEAQSGAPDADTLQQGDQAASDQAASEQPGAEQPGSEPAGSEPAESQSEQAGSETGPSDGPGGYADTSPNADTQQQGEH